MIISRSEHKFVNFIVRDDPLLTCILKSLTLINHGLRPFFELLRKNYFFMSLPPILKNRISSGMKMSGLLQLASSVFGIISLQILDPTIFVKILVDHLNFLKFGITVVKCVFPLDPRGALDSSLLTSYFYIKLVLATLLAKNRNSYS